MSDPKPPQAAPHSLAVSALFLEIFKANGRLLAAGDRLVAPLGLTSARWQVLGAIAGSSERLPVAHLARRMGLTRQGVQRIVNELAMEGLVVFEPNPHHLRAKLVRLSEVGWERFRAAQRLQRPWVDAMAKGLDAGQVPAAIEVLAALSALLDEGEAGE